MTAKLRVYLAGPIRGCNQEQQVWWRKEVKQRLDREFEFEDPTQWSDRERGIPKEIPVIERCDVILANMWRESIGTTLSVVRARQQGKPVVLIDSNHLNHGVLETLLLPEKPVRSIDDACVRLRELAGTFKSIGVKKSDGTIEEFDPKKLAGSVASAAASAGKTDVGLEERILGPVVANLRAEGAQQGVITTCNIRAAVSARLGWMSGDMMLSTDLRSRAAAVLRAWAEQEQVRRSAEVFKTFEERVRRAELDADTWKRLLIALRAQTLPAADAVDAGAVTQPRFGSVERMLTIAASKWKAFLVFHDDATKTAREIDPPLSQHSLEALYALIEKLGTFARNRAYAELDGVAAPDFRELFGNAYAPTETGPTKSRYRTPEYVHGGKAYVALQHLKMTGDRGQKVRVYFDELSRTQFLVCSIGHRETVGFDG